MLDQNRDGGHIPAQEAPIEARELADVVVRAALEKKALDPMVLEVGEMVGYAEYFVIVSARNPRQAKAIAEEVRQVLKHELGLMPVGMEGTETGKWVLLDYDDVVLHVFLEGTRSFYDLETLWSDAPRMPVPEVDPFEQDSLEA
jgi:ribosome-associated protein